MLVGRQRQTEKRETRKERETHAERGRHGDKETDSKTKREAEQKDRHTDTQTCLKRQADSLHQAGLWASLWDILLSGVGGLGHLSRWVRAV